MIQFAELRVSRAFLFKEQTYRGRCLVAYNGHVNDLNELSDEERNAFMADVAQVTRAMQKALSIQRKSTMVPTATSCPTCISIWLRSMWMALTMAARSR